MTKATKQNNETLEAVTATPEPSFPCILDEETGDN